MIQHLKSTHFDDEETAMKIMEATTPLECKRLARDIDNYNQHGWNSIAKSMCESGIKHKLDHNPHLKMVLLKTQGKTIVKCSLDKILGTGVPINDTQALKQNRWINQGILGEIQEELQEHYLNEEQAKEGESENRRSIPMQGTLAPD